MGRSDIKPYTDKLVWGRDEEYLSIVEYTSGGGWYYLPGHSQGTKKQNFGRGDDGRQKAIEYMERQLVTVLSRHNWEIPTDVGEPLKTDPEYANNPSLHAGFTHPIFGDVAISLSFNNGRNSATYEIKCHSLAAVIARRGAIDRKASWGTFPRGFSWKDTIQGDPKVTWQMFKQDPLFHVRTNFNPNLPIVLNPPPELKDQDYMGYSQGRPTGNVTYGFAYRNADLLVDPERVKASIIQSLPDFQRALDAFRFLGIKVDVVMRVRQKGTDNLLSRTWTEPAQIRPTVDATIEEIVITLPRGNQPPFEEPHTIRFSDGGITLGCGYQKNVTLYKEYQAIQDQRLVDEVLGAMTETISIENL